MDIMEKVEALRIKANITYEEAKAVLDETNGDMLDALILLERRGKVQKPETEVITRTEANDEEKAAEDSAARESAEKSAGPSATERSKFRNTMKKIMNVLMNNSFNIYRKGEELFKMPAWAFVLILFFGWHVVIPVLIIALFFDVRYSFTGKDDLSGANQFMDKAASMADEMSSEFK